jgi:GNAT superfamily N-acetyltransferase
MVAVRAAKPEDRAALGAALANAFAQDPLFGWIAGPHAPLEARMRIMFDTLLKLNLHKSDHMVFVAEDGSGGAIWQPIGKWKLPTGELVRALPAMLRAFRARTPAMIGALTAIEKVHPTEPHYFLEVLGTRQDRQSKGVGSSLIARVLDRCDEEGIPAYLESSNPRNVPFYARHFFEVRREIACGKGAPVVTAMWREPRA